MVPFFSDWSLTQNYYHLVTKTIYFEVDGEFDKNTKPNTRTIVSVKSGLTTVSQTSVLYFFVVQVFLNFHTGNSHHEYGEVWLFTKDFEISCTVVLV